MKNFKNIGRRFRRSCRAVSPVIAVLLMIVIAVASALFAYSWVMGYLDFLTIKTDQGVQVQAINWDGTTVRAYVQNVGPANVTISNLYINDELDTDFISTYPEGMKVGAGKTEPITSTIYDPEQDGPQVTVKVTTADGNIFQLKKTVTTTTGGGGGYTLTITPIGSGTVTKNPDQASYANGTVVTLTANPAVDWSFSGWGGDLGGSTNPETITMDGNKVVTATFTLDPVTLTERTTSRFTGSIAVPSGTVNFATAPQEGSLLVLTVGHRVQSKTNEADPTPTVAGWTPAGTEWFKTAGSDQDRRVVSIFYKEAGSSEPTAVTVVWPNADDASTGFAILQEFTPSRDTSYSVARVEGRSSGTSSVTSLEFPQIALTAPSEPYILTIAGTVWRDSEGQMTDNTFDDLGNVVMAIGSTSAARGFTAYANTAVLQTTATMIGSTDPDMVSGLLVLFACS